MCSVCVGCVWGRVLEGVFVEGLGICGVCGGRVCVCVEGVGGMGMCGGCVCVQACGEVRSECTYVNSPGAPTPAGASSET